MRQSILALRFNFWIVCVGAFSLLGLVKLTSLLPAQYYFSFSKLIVGNDGPFLVDTPSVNGRKLCTLMKKYRIDQDHLGSIQIDCGLNGDRRQIEGAADVAPRQAMTPEQKDIIYELAIKHDEKVRAVLTAALKRFVLLAKNDEETRGIIFTTGTPHEAFNKLFLEYEKQIVQNIEDPIFEYFFALLDARLAEDKSDSSQDNDRSGIREKLEMGALNSGDINSILRAHDAFARSIASVRPANINQIAKSAVDRIIAESHWVGLEQVATGIAKFYAEQMGDVVQSSLRQAFAANAIDVKSKAEARSTIFREITAEGLRDYVVSIGIRVLPVILFGLILGFVLGRSEVGGCIPLTKHPAAA